MTAVGSIALTENGGLWRKCDNGKWQYLSPDNTHQVSEETIMTYGKGTVIYKPSPLVGLKDGSVLASKKYPEYVAVKTGGAWTLAGETKSRDDAAISLWFSNGFEIVREIR